MVPAGKRETVLDVLDDEEIDYALTDEDSGRKYTAVVRFPLPVGAVEPVLEKLREAGIERDAYTVIIDAETVISKRFERLTERYEESDEGDGDRIAREELVARAEDLAPRLWTFIIMTSISSIVATAGLLLDSPAVVVGSMVIAPLIGPAMATSVGSVLDEDELFVRGVRLQVLGGVLAVAAAAVFSWLLKFSGAIPLTAGEVFAIGEVRERLAPDVLSLAVALGAGVAGALSLSSGVSAALVGVMIAAALVPPTAVVGIGLAWGEPQTVLGAAVLVLVNFLSVNFAALAVLSYQGYRPFQWFRQDEATESTWRRIATIGVVLLVLSAFLGGVTFTTLQTSQFEDDTRDAIQNVTSGADVRLLSIDYVYGDFPVRHPQQVTVTVGYPPTETPPSLKSELERRINAAYEPPFGLDGDHHVEVEVRYVAVE
ncbi:TIGR00341 family protein [Halogranum amylolyticum]|uniref:TIGR00341 family protein n=2 Tax=Halogranum amylolyticum TaxID=660520 RepID=A0A1H8TQJ4_9EURY|nr:TIGR00341 family protein [Halogranum amylolyticum]